VSLLETIKSRGYWCITIRPSVFDAKRISKITDLAPLLQQCEVNLRGWAFPHLGRDGSARVLQVDFVQDESSWEGYLEVLRFYRSGLFIDYRALGDDWQEMRKLLPRDHDVPPGSWLPIEEAVYQLTEAVEFAARIASTPAGSDSMAIEIQFGNLANRVLSVGPGRMPFLVAHRATAAAFEYSVTLPRVELVGRAREVAVEAALDLFQLFGWDAGAPRIRDVQRQLR
jgi:hypothetical protein